MSPHHTVAIDEPPVWQQHVLNEAILQCCNTAHTQGCSPLSAVTKVPAAVTSY